MCCNFVEYTPKEYLATATDTVTAIEMIDALIMKNIQLIGTFLDGASGTMDMYELDDGQVRIKVNYKTTEEILKANGLLRTMKQAYVNTLNGRTVILRGQSTIRRNYRC